MVSVARQAGSNWVGVLPNSHAGKGNTLAVAERSEPIPGPRFTEALAYAARLHARQTRKGTGIPYISHLLGVCALVLEGGGSEEQAIAALLHDALEDQGNQTSAAEIERRFGPDVARMVTSCTDDLEHRFADWWERKRHYVSHLPEQQADVLLVSVADKLYNVRTILADYRQHGESLFHRFSGGRAGVLWYYRALVDAYRRAPSFSHPLVDELDRTVRELVSLTA